MNTESAKRRPFMAAPNVAHVLTANGAQQAVVGIASQPFWLCWPTGRGVRRHLPDYFARVDDGTGVVIDVRPDERIEDRDAESFALTAAACQVAGWEFRRRAFWNRCTRRTCAGYRGIDIRVAGSARMSPFD